MEKDAPRFAIFRGEAAPSLEESGVMDSVPPSEAVLAGMMQVIDAGMDNGHFTRVLFSQGGMSLAYAWFKSGFPLPRHSHNSDCLYYIVGGSLRLGTEELKTGDGFFIGKDVPYTYTPGENGVEVLEFRTAERFDIKTLAANPAFWAKAAETAKAKRDIWPEENSSPSGLIRTEG
ncbi:MAG TPA: cupin domain-containing protein [Sphingobium sp.]|uniref:cupin domain-containing protein n=1 Tax=Sphingobium sp. TaxID=1912891 RepID=UPI002ED424EA